MGYLGHFLCGDLFRFQKSAGFGGTGAFWDAVQVFIGEQPLRQRRENNGTHLFLLQNIGQAVFDPAVEHGVRRLMDEARGAQLTQHLDGAAGFFGFVVGNAHIERTSAAHNKIQRLHGLFQRSFRVWAVMVENIHILQPHTFEALVQTGDQIFARTPITVRPLPHGVTGFGRNDHLVPVRAKVFLHDHAKGLLG
ncbi:hypothetical protein SDC9_168097 [bioreactor metagenome]|uniref:Uncharacterized protein n=1 Tax=bioreactor metagenome TaxID=1076179 RepID=A0A645G1L4_9ZZZZ